MATATVYTVKTPPPFSRGVDDYAKWKKKFELWQAITDVEKEKQGGLLIFRLDEQTQEAILETLTTDEIKSEEGAKSVLDQLDAMFQKDVNVSAYEKYEHFETYTRPEKMSMAEHIAEFEKRWNKTRAGGTQLSDNVLAYRLLKSSSLTPEKEQLMKATLDKLTVDNVKKKLKQVFTGEVGDCTDKVAGMKIKKEPDDEALDTLYGSGYQRNYNHNQNKFNQEGSSQSRYNRNGRYAQQGNSQVGRKKRNMMDEFGKHTRCHECESITHYVKDCPDLVRKTYGTYQEQCVDGEYEGASASSGFHYEFHPTLHQICLFQDEYDDPERIRGLLFDAIGAAVLDCGAGKTVCGLKWFQLYLDSLSESDRKKVLIIINGTQCYFKFGDGRVIPALKTVKIPVMIGNISTTIVTDVIEDDIPLLLSKQSMKKAKCQLDFNDDTINILGEQVNLGESCSGHYLLPLNSDKQVMIDSDRYVSSSITLYVKEMTPEETALKLHRQFAHPTATKLVKLVGNSSNGNNEELIKAIKEITRKCKVCFEYQKAPPRPIVGLPMARKFNECVAMDLKQFGKVWLLHMIDHGTRLSGGAIIRTKRAPIIIREIFKWWVSIYGAPDIFLTDNGGEFDNEEMRELGEKLNINIRTTAANSPWSNGLVERHNAIMGDMIRKTVADTKCSLEMAVSWCLSAHNSLMNVHGFSPYQLVFGRNPNLPVLMTDKPPAMCNETSSDILRENLNALHAARQAFILKESDDKLRRALSHNIRTSGEVKYVTGDRVYYKKIGVKKWQGPATVIGKDSQKVLVNHGGIYRRVPPCRLSLEKYTVVQGKSKEDQAASCDQDRDESDNNRPSNAESRRVVQFMDELDEDEVLINEPEAMETEERESVESEVEILDQDIEYTQDARDREIIQIETNEENEELGDVDKDSRPGGLESTEVDSVDELQYTEDEVKSAEVSSVDNKDNGSDGLESTEDDLVDENKEQKNLKADIEVDSDDSQEGKKKPGRPKKVRKKSENRRTQELKPGVIVEYREEASEEWLTVKLVSRAGKKEGKYAGAWNTINDEKEEVVLDFERDKVEWKIMKGLEETMVTIPIIEETLTSESVRKSSKAEDTEAKIKELQSWMDNEVYTEVENEGQMCISSKWLLKPKVIDGKQSVKARLVLRGYEEEVTFRTDSPTCMRESVRLVLAIIASKQWKVNSIDFKTAFLQGRNIEREVYMEPPMEVNTGNLWKLNKTVYGLNDAPRSWYMRLKEAITDLGCILSSLDSGLFYWHSEGKLEGVLLSFVDDLLHGGNEEFQREVIDRLRANFKVSHEHDTAFKYIGISLTQNEDGSIDVNQENYANSIPLIPISTHRAKEKTSELSIKERKQLRSAIGQVNWLSGITRPDISYYACEASTSLKNGTVENILNMNKLINMIKNTPSKIHIPSFQDISKLSIRVYADASFGNLSGGGSQGGQLILLTDGDRCCPLGWHSKRLKRVVKSTLASETLSLEEGCESAVWLSNLAAEVITGRKEAKLPILCLTDNKNLWETAHTTHTLEERRLKVEMGIIREMIVKEEIKLNWVRGEEQLSNVMTKKGASGSQLREVISRGKLQ